MSCLGNLTVFFSLFFFSFFPEISFRRRTDSMYIHIFIFLENSVYLYFFLFSQIQHIHIFLFVFFLFVFVFSKIQYMLILLFTQIRWINIDSFLYLRIKISIFFHARKFSLSKNNQNSKFDIYIHIKCINFIFILWINGAK